MYLYKAGSGPAKRLDLGDIGGCLGLIQSVTCCLLCWTSGRDQVATSPSRNNNTESRFSLKRPDSMAPVKNTLEVQRNTCSQVMDWCSMSRWLHLLYKGQIWYRHYRIALKNLHS